MVFFTFAFTACHILAKKLRAGKVGVQKAAL